MLTTDGLTHFVVVHKIYKRKLLVADPSKGLQKISWDEFFNDFDGFAVFCAPTNEFIADKTKTKGVFNRFLKLLFAQKNYLLPLLLQALFLRLLV